METGHVSATNIILIIQIARFILNISVPFLSDLELNLILLTSIDPIERSARHYLMM
jgi:hypothetical protein